MRTVIRGRIPEAKKPFILADYNQGYTLEELSLKWNRSERSLLKLLKENSLAQPSLKQLRESRKTTGDLVEMAEVELDLPMGSIRMSIPVGLDANNTSSLLLQLEHMLEEVMQVP